MTFGIVPIPDDEFLEMPVRYPTLDVPFDVCCAFAHLASWLSMKLPLGWRRPIRIACAGGPDHFDSRAAFAGVRILASSDRFQIYPYRSYHQW